MTIFPSFSACWFLFSCFFFFSATLICINATMQQKDQSYNTLWKRAKRLQLKTEAVQSDKERLPVDNMLTSHKRICIRQIKVHQVCESEQNEPASGSESEQNEPPSGSESEQNKQASGSESEQNEQASGSESEKMILTIT